MSHENSCHGQGRETIVDLVVRELNSGHAAHAANLMSQEVTRLQSHPDAQKQFIRSIDKRDVKGQGADLVFTPTSSDCKKYLDISVQNQLHSQHQRNNYYNQSPENILIARVFKGNDPSCQTVQPHQTWPHNGHQRPRPWNGQGHPNHGQWWHGQEQQNQRQWKPYSGPPAYYERQRPGLDVRAPGFRFRLGF